MDGASFPQEGPEPEPYQPGHDEQRDKQKRLLLVGVRWHRIHCKGLKRAGAPRRKAASPSIALASKKGRGAETRPGAS